MHDLALGLAALGFRRGDRLSVIGDNRPRLYWAQVAAQCLGGVPVPVYQDSIAKELAFVWNHAEISVIVAEDQEQVDKVLSLREQLPALRLVVYDDGRGMSGYKHDWLKSYEHVQEAGRKFGAEHPGYFEAEIDKGRPADVAIISYTSGTTGSPKGAMISHANAIGVAESFARESRLKPEDTSLAYLPMAWAGDSVYTLFASLAVGFCANCPESPETVQRDLRELGPSTLLAPPRIWENMLTSVQVRAADASPLKRRTFEYFRSAAERAEILRADGKPVPAGLRLATGARRVLRLRARPGPARSRTGQVGAHRRGAARARHLPVLPLDRREPETGLRLHRDHRAGVDAARHRGQSHHAPGARCPASRSRSPSAARCSCAAATCSRAI